MTGNRAIDRRSFIQAGLAAVPGDEFFSNPGERRACWALT